MQIAPSNPVLQALAGAESAGTVRPTTAARTETVKAVSATEKDQSGRDVENPPKERSQGQHKRGQNLDILV